MSTAALNSAISGLRIAQKALDVTASNISNAQTEGYTKKTLPQSNVVADGVGIGVKFGAVQRHIDEAALRDYRKQLGVQSYLSTKESYLSRIMALHGATNSENNIGSQMGNLYNEFVTLSANPNSSSSQNSVLSAAKKLAGMFNNFSQQIATIRNDTEKEIKNEVMTLNASLQAVANLNTTIQSLSKTGNSIAELQDQRDMVVKKIAEQLDITYYVDGNNCLVLQTKDGHLLADTQARPISFEGNFLTEGSFYPDSASGIILQDTNQVSFDMASGEPGGKLGALLSLRDSEIPTYTAQVDELAHKMMMRFHDQGMDLFTDAAGGIPGNYPTSYVGIAGKIQVNELVLADPTLLQKGTTGAVINAGDNTTIMNIVNYTFGKYKDASGTLNVAFNTVGVGANISLRLDIINDPTASLQSFATAILDSQASDYNIAKDTLKSEASYTNEVQGRLLESSAVNTDEEMARMIELQRNYSASAKMIQALDELFRDLLNAI